MIFRKIKSMTLCFLVGTLALTAQEWELKKDKKDIKVYTRKVTDSKILEFKAVTQITTTPRKILEVLLDVPSYPSWVPDCNQAAIVKKIGSNSFTYFLELSAPWPVANRDIVVKATTKTQEDQILFEIERVATDTLKIKKNIRMTKFIGSWKLIQTSKSIVKVIHQVHAEPGGTIPAWLANSRVTDGPLHTLNNLKNLIQQSK